MSRRARFRRATVALACVLLVLDAWDAWATIHHLGEWTGMYEGNPVMARVLASSPALFVLLKLAMVAGCSAILVRRGGRLGVGVLAGAVLLYTALAIYHVGILLVPA